MATELNVEREVKLGAGPSFRLPDLDGLDGAAPSEVEALRLETVYYDTPDLRLARWGCSLRHRAGEGWTLKLPGAAAGAALERDEITAAGPPGKPPASLLALVRGYVRRAELTAVARLRTLRRRVRLAGPSGEVAAEVVDDEVSVLDGRRVAARFREIEVELKSGDEALLDALVKRLQAAGAGIPDPTPKLVRALGPAAMGPAEVPAPDIRDGASAGELVRAALARSVASLLHNDPGVRVGGDPERVHDARVATRRLRSDLRTFAPLLDRDWADGLRDELSWIGGALGEVRDSEVLLERIRGRVGELPEADRPGAAPLIRRLSEETAAKRDRLLKEMNSDRYVDLLDRLVVAARDPVLSAEAEAPAAEALPALARRPWRRLSKAVRDLGPQPPDTALHEVRILAKRARYASEAVAPAAGKPAERFASALARVQTILGEHQDSVTAQAWLRGAATSGRPAFAAGELVAAERAAAEHSRERWWAEWKAASRSSLRKWLKPDDSSRP